MITTVHELRTNPAALRLLDPRAGEYVGDGHPMDPQRDDEYEAIGELIEQDPVPSARIRRG